mgnify:CR=1 FL=1|jgi:hypothetical protein
MIVKLKEELTDKERNARSLVEKSREVTMMKEKLEDDIAQVCDYYFQFRNMSSLQKVFSTCCFSLCKEIKLKWL